MDEIVSDMVEQGVEPWVCPCYGNPAYPGGGGTGLGGGALVTIWRDTGIPGKRPHVERVDLTVEGVEFRGPVWVDLLSGRAHRVPKAARHPDGTTWAFTDVPVHDSVVVLADRRAVERSPVDGPEATRQ